MDAGAFVQENKRWLLGVGIGGIVWLIASAVLDSVYSASTPSASKLGAPAGGTGLFDRDALAAARTEGELLTSERQRLQQELGFTQSSKYQLAATGQSSDVYLFQVGRDLRQNTLAAASARDVQMAAESMVWDLPSGIDDIRATLFGLELIDEFQQRLFQAHDATRARAEEAVGLRAVSSLKLESRRNQQRVRTVKAGEVDPRDYLSEERVSFQFQADEATAALVLESCRKPGRTLVIETWQVLKPSRPGEVCTIKGTLLGIAWKEKS
jgi:hypothetical protein